MLRFVMKNSFLTIKTNVNEENFYSFAMHCMHACGSCDCSGRIV